MFKSKTIVAIIPARGGSKGIPRKNLRLIKGKTLLANTIEIAKQSKWIDQLIVSSEDQEIIAEAKKAGAVVPFVRPMELAQDYTTGIEPILHALSQLTPYDYVIVLQPTSPLRNTIDIDQALENLISHKVPACVSVCESDIHPQWMFEMNAQQKLKPLLNTPLPLRRQDIAPTYFLNGAIYAAKSAWLQEQKQFITDETLAYVMPRERSIDIDTEFDLHLAEMMMDKFI